MLRSKNKNNSDEQQTLNQQLINAVEKGKINEVEHLIAAGVDVNARCQYPLKYFHFSKSKSITANFSNVTALHVAAVNGHTEMIQFLIDCGAQLFAYAVSGEGIVKRNILDFSVIENQIKVVEFLLKSYHLQADGRFGDDAENSKHSPPIIIAIVLNYVEVASLLIQYGATNPFYPPYMVCPLDLKYFELIKLLIKNKFLVCTHEIDLNFLLARYSSTEDNVVHQTIELLLQSGFGLFVKMPALIFRLPSQAVVIGMQIDGKLVSRGMRGFSDAITNIKELQEAILQQKSLDIKLPYFLFACESLISAKKKLSLKITIDDEDVYDKTLPFYDRDDSSNEESELEEDIELISRGEESSDDTKYLKTAHTNQVQHGVNQSDIILNELNQLEQITNIINNNLSLKQICMRKVCEFGFFKPANTHLTAQVPNELLEELEEYKIYGNILYT